MAGITTTVDLTYLRVGVTLSTSPFAESRVPPIYRVHTDGSRNLVRGMSKISGGLAFGWDYEAPLNMPVTYEWIEGSVLSFTDDAVTLPAPSRALLTVPGLPSFGGPVLIAQRPEFSRERPTSELNVQGRSTSIVKSDVLKAPTFKLALLTKGDSEAYMLMSTLGVAPVLLLRIPGTRVTDWCYIATGSVSEVPVSRVLPPSISVTTDIVETWAAWEIECRVVDSPTGGVFGDPTATYQASLDQFATYADRAGAHATYIDALRG
jgi:hypothetical protein